MTTTSPSDRRRRAYVETYGCQMNISDGELMEGILESDGYEIVETPEEADVVLVNTCAIRENAERRVLGRVAQLGGLKKERPDLVVGVTGCMAQRLGESLLDEGRRVDLVVGPDGYRGLPDALRRLRGEGWVSPTASPPPPVGPDASGGIESPPAAPRPTSRDGKAVTELAVLDLNLGENYQGLEQRRSDGPSAWVPIQRGCDHRCTYCIVPYVRGGEKNRAADEIIREIRGLAEGGVSDVTLLGQTVNSYRWEDWSFADLLRAVARIDGIRRVWFTSPHPNDVTPEMVEVMATEPAVCEQLHLPAQSGADRVLKRMLRRYTVDSFLEKVEMVRRAIPEVSLSTDIIVAFPGETQDEFEATLDLMRAVRFDDAFTYRYSPRDGTPATRLPEGDFVPDGVAQARLERLIDVRIRIQREINRSEVGRVEEVLVEKEARGEGQILGRTRRNKVVAFRGDPAAIGSYTTVELVETTGATFVGRAVPSPVEAAAG